MRPGPSALGDGAAFASVCAGQFGENTGLNDDCEGKDMTRWMFLGLMIAWMTPGAPAQDRVPDDYSEVLSVLGKRGDFRDNVLKVGLPRTDLSVTVAGIETPTPFGFGGWIALTKGDSGLDVMMGDLVLQENEVNPVMSALLDNGLDVTALHNHFFWEFPRISYMHVHGHGRAIDLARKVKPALDLIARDTSRTSATLKVSRKSNMSLSTSSVDPDLVSQIIGHKGEFSGSVYKITVGRSDFTMREMGAVINSRMGLNSWAAFTGSNDHAAIAGDVAMLEPEVTPVLKALRSKNLDVVAIHHHMIGSHPAVIFLHYWGVGPAATLASGFKAALDELGKNGGMPGMK